MSSPVIIELRQFYSSLLGRRVRGFIADSIKSRWPNLNDDVLGGLGYAIPWLRSYIEEESKDVRQVIPVMPFSQGAIVWPTHGDNRVSLVDEQILPFANSTLNRLLLVHMLEHTESERVLLEECWRVLTPGGRMLVVVPHRLSVWARSPSSPFSQGKPYTTSQLRAALCDDLFTHIHTSYVLHLWPTQNATLLRLFEIMQRFLRVVFPAMGGLIVMEVEKQIYATTGKRASSLSRAIYATSRRRPVMTRSSI